MKPLAIVALLMVAGAGRAGFTQSAEGSLSGKLTDLQSRPLRGAAVTVRNQATGAEFHTTTTKGGAYRFSDLGPGEYTLEAEIPRLGRGQVEGIVVTAGHEARVQAALELTPPPFSMVAPRIEPTAQELTATPARVQAEMPRVEASVVRAMLAPVPMATLPLTGIAGSALTPDLTSPSESDARNTTLSGAQLQALPVTGRNWQSFVFDSPAGSSQAAGESRAGLRRGDEAAAMTVDGSSIRLAFGGAGVGRMSGRGAALIGPGASEAAIREVQKSTGNVDASEANAAGGRMNVETQRGADGLHGQASLFTRQNLWGAQNPFTQWWQQTAPATLTTVPTFTPVPLTPSDRETTWGFGAGGRFGHSKLLWFAALDSYQRNDPGVSMVKHPENFFAQPSNDQMQVLGARLGLSSNNPVAVGVGAYSTMLATLDGLLGPAPRTSTRWTGFGRLDWSAGERHRFTVEGTGAEANAPGGGLTRAAETYGSHSYGSSRVSEQWLLGRWEAFVTPNLLAVTQGSVGRHNQGAPPEQPSPYEQTLNISSWGQLPQIVVDSRYGFTIGNPAWFGPGSYPDEHLYQAQEQLSWVHGKLMVKAGATLSHNTDATSLLRNQSGTYHYASVENFASDALAFAAFGLNGQLNPMDQHNCDQTGKVWRDSAGTLHGLGYLPCYSYYSQTMGPTNWWLSTNEWAGYVTAQWEATTELTLSLAMRWEREPMPPPIAALNNPDLPLTETLPDTGNLWGPRASLAWGSPKSRWPVLRLGYGMYFGPTANVTFENALTQTGSLKGDLNFFMRPTDNLVAGGAPPFPYVLAGEPVSVVKPGAVEFAPNFRNGEIHQAVASLEETLPGHMRLEASAEASLGRRLPVTVDANIDPAVNPQTITYAVVDGDNSGPIKARQITVPFFASWPSANSSAGFGGRLNPNYQQVTELESRANSTYEAAIVRLSHYGRGGLTLRVRYTYAHAMDWNPNESAQVTGPSMLDPNDFRQEYGTSNLDERHSASTSVIWEPKWKLRDWAGKLGNGWTLSGVGTFQSGLPYSMRTAGSLAKEFDTTGAAIVAIAPGMNGYGGDNRVYGEGRNTFRYPAVWKADMRLGKNFKLGERRQLELLAESFNLFNHRNVTRLETVGYTIQSGSPSGSLPTLSFLTGLKINRTTGLKIPGFGQPLNINGTNFYRPRQIQFGIKLLF